MAESGRGPVERRDIGTRARAEGGVRDIQMLTALA